MVLQTYFTQSVEHVVMRVAERLKEAGSVTRGDDVVVHLKQGSNVTKRP